MDEIYMSNLNNICILILLAISISIWLPCNTDVIPFSDQSEMAKFKNTNVWWL